MWVVVSFLTFLIVSASADRGMVAIRPTAVVYEPGQKAILSWNGSTEVMLLATDVYASEDTMVFEILPLPSKPDVRKGSNESFNVIARIIQKNFLSLQHLQKTLGSDRSGGLENTPGVEVVFHEKIGVHDITVAKANDFDEFVEWSEDFLSKNGITYSVKSSTLASVASDYVRDGFKYFVFDLVNVSKKKEKSVEPVLYTFESKALYYPLRISSVVPGDSEITLFTLTGGPFQPLYLPLKHLIRVEDYIVEKYTPTPVQFPLRDGERSLLDSDLKDIHRGEIWLSVLEYGGSLRALDEDLLVTEEDIRKDALGKNITRSEAVSYYVNALEYYRSGSKEKALEEASKAKYAFSQIGDAREEAYCDRLLSKINALPGVSTTTFVRPATMTTLASPLGYSPASTKPPPADILPVLIIPVLLILILAVILYARRKS